MKDPAIFSALSEGNPDALDDMVGLMLSYVVNGGEITQAEIDKLRETIVNPPAAEPKPLKYDAWKEKYPDDYRLGGDAAYDEYLRANGAYVTPSSSYGVG
jgi:hypothetical protein